MKRWWIAFVALTTIPFLPGNTTAQTPDGQTPAEEEICDKYEGQGARQGLCVAYCEAQDCDGVAPGTKVSCDRLAGRFADYSAKKNYPDDTIACRTSTCSDEIIAHCGDKELECANGESCVVQCAYNLKCEEIKCKGCLQ